MKRLFFVILVSAVVGCGTKGGKGFPDGGVDDDSGMGDCVDNPFDPACP